MSITFLSLSGDFISSSPPNLFISLKNQLPYVCDSVLESKVYILAAQDDNLAHFSFPVIISDTRILFEEHSMSDLLAQLSGAAKCH